MKVLCRYNFFDVNTGRIIGNNTPKDAYIVVDSAAVPSDYTNINSIDNIAAFGSIACQDELGVHYLMKDTFYTMNARVWKDTLTDAQKQAYWDNLTNAEKDIVIENQFYTDFYHNNASTNMATYLIVDKGIAPADVEDYLIDAYSTISGELVGACYYRGATKNVIKVVAKYLATDDALDFRDLVRELLDDYTAAGLIGIDYSDSDTPALIDWIISRPNTPYANTGLASQGYTIKNGRLLADLIQDLKDLLVEKY
jgi:hypothetical protein